MKKTILISIFLLLGLFVVSVSAVPPLPADYYGMVIIDNDPAPVGTEIVAKSNFNECGRFTVVSAGQYGGESTYDDRLSVSVSEEDFNAGTPVISFWYGDYQASQNISFVPGAHTRLSLVFNTGQAVDPDTEPRGSGEAGFNIGNINETINSDGKQEVEVNTVDPTSSANVTVDADAKEIVISGTSGWEQVIIHTEDTPQVIGDVVTGTVSEVVATSKPITASNVPGNAGNVQTQIQLNLNTTPGSDAKVDVVITKEPDAEAKSSFVLAAADEGKTIDIAFTMNIQKTNLVNGEDIKSATLLMSVSKIWVDGVGIDTVVIFRNNEGVTEKLATTCKGEDPNNPDNYLFEALSPNGLSVFVLSALQTPAPGPSPGPSGGGGGGGGSAGLSSFMFDPTGTIDVTTGALYTSLDGTTSTTVTVETPEKSAFVTILAGTTAHDSLGYPLTSVTIMETTPSTSPDGYLAAGPAILLTPHGSTFDPSVQIVFDLTSDEWNQVKEDQTFVVCFWDASANQWTELPTWTSPSSMRVLAETNHFSEFAVFIKNSGTATIPELPSEKLPATASQESTSSGSIAPFGLTQSIIGIILVIVVIAGVGTLLVWRRKRV